MPDLPDRVFKIIRDDSGNVIDYRPTHDGSTWCEGDEWATVRSWFVGDDGLTEPERALREAVEAAYREGFEDGFDHGTLSYKYPDVDQAWPQSQAAAFLARHKETP